MGKDKKDDQPKTPEERAEWFANAAVEDSQDLADFHGDATAHRRS